MDYRKYKRNIYSPKMSKGRLENLLRKSDLSDADKEALLDYHWLIIAAPQWAEELGLMKMLMAGCQPIMVPKDVWWTINIEAKTKGFESKCFIEKEERDVCSWNMDESINRN